MCRSATLLALLVAVVCVQTATAANNTLVCPSGNSTTMAGGFKNVNLDAPQLVGLAPLLGLPVGNYLNNVTNVTTMMALEDCGFYEGGLNATADVYKVCSQVVAGTNYIFQYLVDACGIEMDVSTKIFVPLPSSNNTLPSVTDSYIKIL